MTRNERLHSYRVAQGMRHAWRARGTTCPECGRRYLKPRNDLGGSGMYIAHRINLDVCPRCDSTHERGRSW